MPESSEPQQNKLQQSTEKFERSFLGTMMLSFEPPAEWTEDLGRGHFFSYSHQLIYQAIREQLKESDSASAGSVVESLRRNSALETAGGEAYIYEIIEGCADGFIDMEKTKETIIRHHRLRRIGENANAALRAAFGAEGDLETAENRTRDLLGLLESRKPEVSSVTTALDGVIKGAKQTFLPAVKTGWKHFDKAVRLSPGRLIVLGARPGVGKTTLSTQMAMQILAMDNTSHVLYCSVEMDAAEIGLKALSMMTGTDCVRPFQENNAKEIEHVLWRAGHHSAQMARLHVAYTTNLDTLINRANKIAKESNLKMVVCDFISSMQPTGAFATKTEAIGSVSKALKLLSRNLQIPVLAVSQLNRGTAANRRPTMKDLRDSGEIEQDADVVMLLSNSQEENEPNTLLSVEKNRFGIPADFMLEPELMFHRFRMVVR